MIGGEPYTLGLFDTAGMLYSYSNIFLHTYAHPSYEVIVITYILYWQVVLWNHGKKCELSSHSIHRLIVVTIGCWWQFYFRLMCSLLVCFILPTWWVCISAFNTMSRLHLLNKFVFAFSRSGRLRQVTTSELSSDRRLPRLFLCRVPLLLWKCQRKGKWSPSLYSCHRGFASLLGNMDAVFCCFCNLYYLDVLVLCVLLWDNSY